MDRSWHGWAPLPLRLMLGAGFIYHGYPKFFTAEGRTQFAGMLAQIGMPAPKAMAWLGSAVEVFGGLAPLLGLFTTVVSLLLTIEMLVAMFTVHFPQGFSFIHIVGMTPEGPQFGMPGYEVNLLYIAGLLALAMGGPGALAISRARTRPLPAAREQHAPTSGMRIARRSVPGLDRRKEVG